MYKRQVEYVSDNYYLKGKGAIGLVSVSYTHLNLVIVAKDYDDNGARGSGVMMVSKQDNSNDVLLILYKGPDLSNSKLEKVIGAMLSTNFKR